MKISHSAKKSDNLGIDGPYFLNNRLHPTWLCAGGDCLGFLTGICSLFSCLILCVAWHFFFYYVTKLLCGSYNTTCPSGINVNSPLLPWNLKNHFTDVWLIWSSGSRSHRSRLCCKTWSHARPFWRPVAGQKERKKERKKYLCLLWRWFQMKSVPVKAPLKMGLQCVTARWFWAWGCSLQILLFLHFREDGRRWHSKFVTIKKNVYWRRADMRMLNNGV